ncbi:histone-lysine N-methyltransferase 2D-like [Pollicipes pollicipes]|uniref:histone-lysine N-methyltransferase 2D-like n=1 Tax=Pollicipes pollicipes TaxID=41117 RepID=UPI0018856910|nr:histone-lysine N-methyltransferase 2D-like [Pollicipes pollicipes]
MNTKQVYCVTHLSRIPADGEEACINCDDSGALESMLFCSSCGNHFHADCTTPPLPLSPNVRAGWQCPSCKVCQHCRQPGEEGRQLCCDSCDKAFHIYCVRPTLGAIPKSGWKCRYCRVCTDCGSRTPGAGISCRWHNTYSVCDSCYQQRNKGVCCPVCGRAYRHFAQKTMQQCSACRRYVHSTCDPEADPSAVQQRRQAAPDYEYVCSVCQTGGAPARSGRPHDDGSLDSHGDVPATPGSAQPGGEPFHFGDDVAPRAKGGGKPMHLVKKKLGIKSGSGGRLGVKPAKPAKIDVLKKKRLPDLNRKRPYKAKVRGMFGAPAVSLQRPENPMGHAAGGGSYYKTNPNEDNQMVLCSSKDEFVLQQDVCVMCGSFGQDMEGRVIACSQCGQAYHPYCINVKVSKVLLERGFRCLDCTVCEGCGQKNDESRLILCDECDISYHTYCLKPPLDYVPQGGWKCQWCAVCVHCGSNSPGVGCSWLDNYSMCGPCGSLTRCATCEGPYTEGQLIIQCSVCQRWGHAADDFIHSEEDAEVCATMGYMCARCRPADEPPPHMQPSVDASIVEPDSPEPEQWRPSKHFFVLEGVCVSDTGCKVIQGLTIEPAKKKKKRVDCKSDGGISAAIDSVLGNTSIEESEEADGPAESAAPSCFKDGMVLPAREDGAPPEPPDGFSISRLESGDYVIRKKRTRNMQKIGVGGFYVKARGPKILNMKDEEERQEAAQAAAAAALAAATATAEGGAAPLTPGAPVTPTDDSHTPVSAGDTSATHFAVPGDKPKKKAVRRNKKYKLIEAYPLYLQESFFGKELMDGSKDAKAPEGEEDKEEPNPPEEDEDDIAPPEELCTVQLSKAEKELVREAQERVETEERRCQQERDAATKELASGSGAGADAKSDKMNETDDDADDALGDIFPGLGADLEGDLVDTILNDDGDELAKHADLEDIPDSELAAADADMSGDEAEAASKDELSELLAGHWPDSFESMVTGLPNMDGQDVEDLLKDTLDVPAPPAPFGEFGEPSSGGEAPPGSTGESQTYNQRNMAKWEHDESLGEAATISPVLYANHKHPELRAEFPAVADRVRQIMKIWRALSPESKQPYLQKAKENRSASKEAVQPRPTTLQTNEQQWRQMQRQLEEDLPTSLQSRVPPQLHVTTSQPSQLPQQSRQAQPAQGAQPSQPSQPSQPPPATEEKQEGDDDDELLGIGDDFNLLNYAHPELGEHKTVLELVGEESEEQESRAEADGASAGAAPGAQPLQPLSDMDFEKLKADVMAAPAVGMSPPAQARPMVRAEYVAGAAPAAPHPPMGQMYQGMQTMVRPQMGMQQVQAAHDPGIHPALLAQQRESTLHSQRAPPALLASPAAAAPPPVTLTVKNTLAPPLPVDNPQTPEQFKAMQDYEQWLLQEQQVYSMQLKTLEVEITKYRKQRRSFNSKQRTLRKNNQELSEVDALEFDRICAEQAAIQKQIESVRKGSRQHNALLQEHRNKRPKPPAPPGAGGGAASPGLRHPVSPLDGAAAAAAAQFSPHSSPQEPRLHPVLMQRFPPGARTPSPQQMRRPSGGPLASPHYPQVMSPSPFVTSPQPSPMMSPAHVASPGGVHHPQSPHTPQQTPENVLLKKLLQNAGCATTLSSGDTAVAGLVVVTKVVMVTTSGLVASRPLSLGMVRTVSALPATAAISTPAAAAVRDGAGTPQTPPGAEVGASAAGTLPCSSATTPTSSTTLPPDVLQRAREAEEMKKQKRRQYQQKRRQSQGKEGGTSKKRPRKGSKLEEDYDAFLETLMSQLAALPTLSVQEPPVPASLGVVAPPGAGPQAANLGRPDYEPRLGELRLRDGDTLEARRGAGDYYSRRPFGDRQPLPTTHTLGRTILGFYEQEFGRKDDIIPCRRGRLDGLSGGGSTPARDADSPDTVISSSSPETVVPDCSYRYPGLRLIEDDWLEPPERARCASPDIPLIAPVPVRPRPGVTSSQLNGMDKENKELSLKSHLGIESPLPPRDSGQVTVTLTLTSEKAQDVGAVLRSLASLLNISPPSGYQVIERTGTPPSQRLGLYRQARGKDGRDQIVDIQTILNGKARFCQYCEVVILSDIITKAKTELPFVRDADQLADEVHFCSQSCYGQFTSSQLTPAAAAERRAAAVVDHTGGDMFTNGADPFTKELLSVRERQLSRHESGDSSRHLSGGAGSDRKEEPGKRWKNIRYRTWSEAIRLPKKYRKPSDNELTQLLFQMGICIMPSRMPEEVRRCLFCQLIGDAMSDGPARLLNFDVDKWVHLNCALWADDVYETESGSLVNVDVALKKSLNAACTLCKETGASIKCFKVRCDKTYHLTCSVKDKCTFYKNKTVFCREHIPKGEKDNELTTLAVYRRVYIEREENKQVAVVMHQAGSDQSHLLRVGTLVFLSVGQLLPHQLSAFHTGNYIYPIGYKIIRLYWSFRRVNKRCQYICSIQERDGLPEFQIVVREPPLKEITFTDATCLGVWKQVLKPLSRTREEAGMVRLFPQYVTGEDLFGLTEPGIIKILESLPGIDTLTDYRFKYGRNPLLELPLAINPTGCARSEAKLRTHFKRPHTQRPSGGHSRALAHSSYTSDSSAPYSKQYVHSRSSQYKKMKQEWRNNVYLARSKIQGLGLYAARPIEKFTMIIEYIGEVIRNEIAECREKRYEAANRGIYMFRVDENHVVDATLSGGLARYINHSCNPNCITESVEVDRGHHKIIIFANRRIQRGEELAYDYKFDIEDDSNKIPCLCGAPNCRKWMN